MEQQPQRRQRNLPKTLTLSFGDDIECIVIDDSMEVPAAPTTNLNGTYIDLTDESMETDEVDTQPILQPAQAATSSKKTLELDMRISKDIINLTSPSPPKVVNEQRSHFSNFDLNQNQIHFCQPSTSKQLIGDSKEVDKQTTSRKTLELSLHTSVMLTELREPPRRSSTMSVYQRLLEIETKKLIANQEDFFCSLCLVYCPKGVGVTLKHCLHSFCRHCLVRTINTKAEFGAVKCPLQVDNCDLMLDEGEIQELLGEDGYKIFMQTVQLSLEEIADQNDKSQNEEAMNQDLYPVLLNMDFLETLPNLKPFECPVCFTEIEVGEGIVLKNCLHACCKECLAGCVAAAEDFEVKCPFIHPDNVVCTEVLQEREIKSLVSEEMFEKHLQKSLNVAEHANELTFHCRFPNCPAFVELDPQILDYRCPACNRINCVKCKAIHEGKSCLDYQEEINPALKDERTQNENLQSQAAIDKMIADGKAMYCPRCKIPVMKIAGCDFITCTACKLGICWCTKKPRLNFTRADGTIVEGCKCRENGRRCHPQCGNCH